MLFGDPEEDDVDALIEEPSKNMKGCLFIRRLFLKEIHA
jgi:hypothetical protein